MLKIQKTPIAYAKIVTLNIHWLELLFMAKIYGLAELSSEMRNIISKN